MTDLTLTEDQKKTLLAFLDNKERDKLLLEWLKEFGLGEFKANLIVKAILPLLAKLAGETGKRFIAWTNDKLKNRFDWYKDWSEKIARMLFYKIETQTAQGDFLIPYLGPPKHIDLKQWETLKEETTIKIQMLEKLESIALGIENLQPTVRLELKLKTPDSKTPLNRLLKPDYAFIPMLGRKDIMERLQDWCGEESAFGWQVIHGEAGVGKTRLAQELAGKLRGTYWDAGFLESVSLNHLVTNPGFPNWEPLVETLIIVDYAAPKLDNLKILFDRCLRWAEENRPEEGAPRLRILLLERNAETGQSWMKELVKGQSSSLVEDMEDSGAPPFKLEHPVETIFAETAVEILRNTLDRWKKLNPKPEKPIPSLPPFSEEDEARLWEITGGRPLYLQLSAIHACIVGGADDLLKWTGAHLLEAAVERERNTLIKQIPDKEEREVTERIIALIFFLRAMSPDDPKLMSLIEEETKTCGYPSIQPANVILHLTILYGEGSAKTNDETIIPIQPDLIGAAFSVTVLQEKPNSITDSLNRAININEKDAWSFLLLATQDLYAIGDFSPEAWLKPLLKERTREELWKIATLIPHKTISLVTLGKDVFKSLRDHQVNPESEMEEAWIFHNLSQYLGKLNKPREALNAAQQAVNIREKLARNNTEAFLSDFASSLDNLGIQLHSMGKLEEAHQTILKAVKLKEILVERNHDKYLPLLANSLNNLGGIFNDLSKYQESFDVTRRVVDIRKDLAKKNPNEFVPYFAVSIGNLANQLNKLGRLNEAVIFSENALKLIESFAKKNPDSFNLDLANCLNNLGLLLIDLEKAKEGVERLEQAIQKIKPYFLKNPSVHAKSSPAVAARTSGRSRTCRAAAGRRNTQRPNRFATRSRDAA